MRAALAVLLAAGTALVVSAAAVVPAQAANTRVSITDFRWSKNPDIDLGESVTWDWIGPDTQHSVSGQPDNATQWDSDPGPVNSHPLGDTFTVTFDQPGVYLFVCKLHSTVRGTVTVSGNPGDPNSDPGPQAALNLDFLPPNFVSAYLARTSIGPRGKGTAMNFQINERGTVTSDYYRLVKRGKGERTTWKRKFAGYDVWENHIGNNTVNFARRGEGFEARPGRYVGLTYATDEAFNSTPVTKLKFQIHGKKGKRGKK